VGCSRYQCVAVCCSVLQCVAVGSSGFQWYISYETHATYMICDTYGMSHICQVSFIRKCLVKYPCKWIIIHLWMYPCKWIITSHGGLWFSDTGGLRFIHMYVTQVGYDSFIQCLVKYPCEWIITHLCHIQGGEDPYNDLSCRVFFRKRVMSHTWMSRVTHMTESCQTYEWVMAHIWIRWVMSHIRMSHVTHTNETRHAYEWDTSNMRMSRVTHMSE